MKKIDFTIDEESFEEFSGLKDLERKDEVIALLNDFNQQIQSASSSIQVFENADRAKIQVEDLYQDSPHFQNDFYRIESLLTRLASKKIAEL